MNREQAMQVLSDGFKLTHPSFTKEEWVKGVGDGMYRFEDGIECNVDVFWLHRKDKAFDKGWHVLTK